MSGLTRLRHLLLTTPVIASLLISTAAVAGPPGGGPHHGNVFTLVVIPDTQLAVQNKPELFYAQTRWILDQREQRRIPFVIHLGDVVEWPSRVSDWERGTTAMYPLNDAVPYAIAVGNHDLDAWACTPEATCDPWAGIAADRSTTMFNTYFPESMFRRWHEFRGSYPRGAMDNSYFTFRAGRVHWLVLTVKFDPTDDELAWADQIIRRHPHHQVILTTHEYLRDGVRTPVGERVWENLARRYGNVRFVLSGHYTRLGTLISEGDAGNLVYQIQADYQTYSIPRVNNNSYLRLMEFDTAAGTVGVRTFSPYCEATGECPAYLTDPINEFTLTAVDFPVRRT